MLVLNLFYLYHYPEIGGFSNGIIFSTQLILYLYSNNIILWHCIFSVISSDEIKERLDNPVVIKLDKEDNFKKIKSDIINVNSRPKINDEENGEGGGKEKKLDNSHSHILRIQNLNNLERIKSKSKFKEQINR